MEDGGKEFSDTVKEALMLGFALRIRRRSTGLNHGIKMNLPLPRLIDCEVRRHLGCRRRSLCRAVFRAEDKGRVHLHVYFIGLRGWQGGRFRTIRQARTCRIDVRGIAFRQVASGARPHRRSLRF